MNQLTKRSFFLFAFFLIIVTGCRALLEAPIDGNMAFDNKQYATAIDLLNEEYRAASDLIKQSEIAYKIAESYRASNQTKQAEIWYEKAMQYSSDPTVAFKHGLMLKANGKYKLAAQKFKEYSVTNPLDRTRAVREMQACKQAAEWIEKGSDFRVVNLKKLNSPASDFAPVLYQKNQLVFTSARENARGANTYGWTGEKHTDLFSSKIKGELAFATPISFGDTINTSFNEGTATFSPDYQIVYFTACGSAGKENDYCKIYVSYKNESGEWAVPEKLDLFEVDSINVGQPYLNPNGTQLYFAADAPDSFGGKDLYVVTKTRDGFWSYPENLGPAINTAGYEGFPHIGADSKLYFASDGHTGMGGLDIFRATLDKKGKWQNPVNLQAPVNSPADDFGIVFEPFVNPALIDSIEALGYFCSSREGGVGNDDIYRFVHTIPPEPIAQPEPVDTPVVALKPEPKPKPEPEPKPEPKPEPVDTPLVVLKPEPPKEDTLVVAPPPPKPEPKPVVPPPPPKPIALPPPPPPVRKVVQPPPKPVLPTVYVLRGKIFEKQLADSGNPNSQEVDRILLPNAVVEVLGMTDASKLAKRLVTDSKGAFKTVVEKDTDYKVTASKPKFFTESGTASTKFKRGFGNDTMEVYIELALNKIVERKEIVLENIYYDLDEYYLRSDALPTLNKLAELLLENPSVTIELGSHTDSRGTDSYNLTLSQKRAQSVVNYLISKGINPNRLVAKGYGEKRLVNECENGVDCSEESHQRNRRTTFEVLSSNFSD